MAQGGKVLDWTLMKRRGRDFRLDLESKKDLGLEWTQVERSRDLGLDLGARK